MQCCDLRHGTAHRQSQVTLPGPSWLAWGFSIWPEVSQQYKRFEKEAETSDFPARLPPLPEEKLVEPETVDREAIAAPAFLALLPLIFAATLRPKTVPSPKRVVRVLLVCPSHHPKKGVLKGLSATDGKRGVVPGLRDGNNVFAAPIMILFPKSPTCLDWWFSGGRVLIFPQKLGVRIPKAPIQARAAVPGRQGGKQFAVATSFCQPKERIFPDS